MSKLADLSALQRDQGQRSTCLSIALSDGHWVARGTAPVLSPEHLHFHATQRSGVGPNDPVPLNHACDALSADGHAAEFACPYSTVPRPLGWRPPPGLDPVYRYSTVTLNSDPLQAIHNEIGKGLSAVIVLAIDLDFVIGPRNGSELAVPTGPIRGYHAVLALRTRISPGGVHIRNCWGPSWGDNGNAWISEQYLRARLYRLVGFLGPA